MVEFCHYSKLVLHLNSSSFLFHKTLALGVMVFVGGGHQEPRAVESSGSVTGGIQQGVNCLTAPLEGKLYASRHFVSLRQDSKKLGIFRGKWNGETETRKLNKASLSNLQPADELQDLISPNQRHLRANGVYLSSLTGEYITSLAINHWCLGKRGMLTQMKR